jgi:signal transduction histidine kinase
VLALGELMARSVEPGSPTAERLAQVHESGLEIRRLLSAVQDLARAEVNPEPSPVTVAPVLLDAVDLVRRISLRKDLDLVERYDDDGAAVLASRGQLRLALLVILVDAQEATAEGGRIEVATARRGDRVTVVTRWSGSSRSPVRLETLDRLADDIVAAWGGTLRRTARKGGGGEAVISLPRLESDSA